MGLIHSRQSSGGGQDAVALVAPVANRPHIAGCRAAPRRLRSNENDTFRHYPELDG